MLASPDRDAPADRGVRRVLARGPSGAAARACRRRDSSCRLQSPDPSSAVRSLFPLPRPRRQQAQGQAASGYARWPVQGPRSGHGGRHAWRPGPQRDDSPHPVAVRRRGCDATGGRAPGADGGGEGPAGAVGERGRAVPRPLVVGAGRVTAGADADRRRPDAHRCVRPLASCSRGRGAVAAGRTGGAVAAALVQPHGPAAEPGRHRRLSRGSLAICVRASRRPPARLASLWRADGRATGSISRATPTPTGTRPTSPATCRRTATG